ncbi:hypothetical protein F5148DRAFT_517382 [Russula earlei]|uniref:Uncharacterized protein n=1 Tax=Russula earlei TaxID=71964 RepID=A0ACC0TWW6_9AGAM|nr:hypothetical protein F5148DRAFT_517382 [Russula earlei]
MHSTNGRIAFTPRPFLAFSSPFLASTMIVILAILAAVRASPVGQTSPPHVSLDQVRAVSCDDPNECRSLWDIIRNCAITILLCTWVSVHPNSTKVLTRGGQGSQSDASD